MNELETMNTLFEEIKHTDEEGREYWLARELQVALGYTEYRKFAPVINKAKIACESCKNNISNHFAHVDGMIRIGKG